MRIHIRYCKCVWPCNEIEVLYDKKKKYHFFVAAHLQHYITCDVFQYSFVLYLSIDVMLSDRKMFSSPGRPTAPTIISITTYSQNENRISVKVLLKPPVYGQECVKSYNVTDRAHGAWGSNGITDVLVPNLSVCPSLYTFTAVSCSPGFPCSDESDPVMYHIAVSKYIIHFAQLINSAPSLISLIVSTHWSFISFLGNHL